jgi:SAM-dependent methyltransferase
MTSDFARMRDQQHATWDRFAVGWKSWDTTVKEWLSPVGAAMIRHANLHDHSDVLDVATGTGEPGLSVAALIPQGRVTLTDLAEQMLAVAVGHAADRGLANVATQACDAGSLPFPDKSYDAVLCRFGFMFFPDLAAAASELARVARPDARLAVAVWSRPELNPWATTIMGTIARYVPTEPPDPDTPGLFRCAPEHRLQEVITQAGFRDITVEEVSFNLTVETAEQYWDFMTDVAAPVVAGLARASEKTQKEIRTDVLRLAQRYMSEGRLQMPATATIIAGTR